VASGFAMAQAEPTLHQIYEATQAGKLDQAQVMMQQVLVAHPNSAKAHFVQAEISARQGKTELAREALATAEKLAPGLPFAKPEAVQGLRSQLGGKPGTASIQPTSKSLVTAASPAATGPASAPGFPWGWALALGGGAIALALLMRKKPSPPVQPAYSGYNPGASGGSGSGLAGPQGFGTGQPGGYAQPAGSGLGGKLAGGLATGLAVGAGMMAAQAIGKTLMDGDDHSARHNDAAGGNGYSPVGGNADMGGQDFGINDGGSWDDAGGGSGGGGDWDN
ncbi:MAG: hypothetical protein RLZZ401_1346, partial [Pseudomonadota bacterium]